MKEKSKPKKITPTALKVSRHQMFAREIGLKRIAEEYDDSLLARLGITNQSEHLTDDVQIIDGENGIYKVK